MTNVEAINWIINLSADIGKIEHQDLWHYEQALDEIKNLLEDAQPERNFCRTCKWAQYFGSVDKYGSIESSWYCKNWEGYTDEEGFCHEWNAKSEVNDEDR